MLALVLLILPAAALAADAHVAVQAKHGEIVVLRNVAARPAVRQEPPGMALIVDPSPRRELTQALGTDELSDADYASLDATSANSNAHHTTIERMVGNTLKRSTGSGTGVGNSVSGNGFSNVVAAPIGVVGNTTGNIGNQVQGALSQLPGLIPSPGNGH
ncbi:MAG TPA: hypothetical protein VMV99_07040 [Rhodanobacter sp.]|nr:hypothetical protein [Rhodanobacter sp.]